MLVDVELLDACYGKRFIIVPSSEHGYNLHNDHKDEDLTLIKKRRAYKKIWQWKYKLHQTNIQVEQDIHFAKEKALVLARQGIELAKYTSETCQQVQKESVIVARSVALCFCDTLNDYLKSFHF